MSHVHSNPMGFSSINNYLVNKYRDKPVQKLGNPSLEGLSLRLNDMTSDSPPPRYFVLKSASKDFRTFEYLTNLQFQIQCPQFHCEFPSNGCRFRKGSRLNDYTNFSQSFVK